MDFVNKNFQLVSLLAAWLVFACGAAVLIAASVRTIKALLAKKEPDHSVPEVKLSEPRRRTRRLKPNQIRCSICAEPVDVKMTKMDGQKTVLVYECACGKVTEIVAD